MVITRDIINLLTILTRYIICLFTKYTVQNMLNVIISDTRRTLRVYPQIIHGLPKKCNCFL